jgi:hypothetical protein
MAELICTWMERGIQATTIHEALFERYGFTGGYDSVKRFIRRNKKAAPATVFLDHPPAETAQVDFGAGPVIMDPHRRGHEDVVLCHDPDVQQAHVRRTRHQSTRGNLAWLSSPGFRALRWRH